MALAWQACWDLPLPLPRQIGELIATEIGGKISLTVGPDRHYSLGGPFTHVRLWLKTRIRHALASLERAYGIDDWRDEYLASIRTFVDTRLDQMPETIDECPVVALHVDMGLHNALVSTQDHTKINAIIDWGFSASAPFLAAYNCIDQLFRMGAENGFGTEYPHADELREAFWDAIPRWKVHWESQSAKDFMEWFQFAVQKTSLKQRKWSSGPRTDVWLTVY
ncbi:hypothetical protein K431DRAFT_289808 [Polychaeton citri CBS 116435]|uniref:Aminoglycoside phosphotransferase domain-containing protein n=1 Tax=Polychaeton citri CBS 116435 TaxID=1314669 RepID=A0A9P4UHP4_9PEZI|nr:hypothetical protein K431DRAFT_289808 [Polychaeton citri CBS 116435]